MGKLILAVIVFALVWWLLAKYWRSLAREEPHREAAPEDMVRCARCGVHLPRSESHARGGEFFCCEEHMSR